MKKLLWIFTVLLVSFSFPLRVSFFISGDFGTEKKALSEIVERTLKGFKDMELFPSDGLSSMVTDVKSLLLVSRINRLRYVFLLEKAKGGIDVKLIDVRAGEVIDVGKTDREELENFLKKEINERFEHKGISFKRVGIKPWEKGEVYKRGDFVRYNEKLYMCQKLHYSTPGNEPGKGDFWKLIKGKYIAGYYASWTSETKSFSPLDIDASMVNLVLYAFANISDDGRCVVGDPKLDPENFKELMELKEKHPRLKVLISVGGWNWSKNFSNAALTEESRRRFAKSCVDTFIRGSDLVPKGLFDGVDVDWEYPTGGGKYPGRPEDKENFTLLMKELRKELSKAGKGYLLTFAGGADNDYIFKKVNLKEVSKYADLIIVMTYDFKGWWDKITGFQSELYPVSLGDMSIDETIESYMKAGAPASKILLGIPFYGRSWSGVPKNNDGLFQKAEGAGPGTKEAGVLDYSDIVNRFEPRMRKFFHPIAQVPWLYGDGIFITYDDPHSASLKALYALEKGLGGVAIWELSCDLPGSNSLLKSVYDILGDAE